MRTACPGRAACLPACPHQAHDAIHLGKYSHFRLERLSRARGCSAEDSTAPVTGRDAQISASLHSIKKSEGFTGRSKPFHTLCEAELQFQSKGFIDTGVWFGCPIVNVKSSMVSGLSVVTTTAV